VVLETLLGGGIGALARLAPEVIKLLDRKNERKHELSMLDKQNESERLRGERGERELQMNTELAQMQGGLAAVTEALKGQFVQTGIKWVDAINQTVRPFLTYLIAGPYALGKFAVFISLLWTAGVGPDNVQAALAAAYTGADMAIVAGILNFYFLGRVFDKRGS
jgi:hypothetical protein